MCDEDVRRVCGRVGVGAHLHVGRDEGSRQQRTGHEGEADGHAELAHRTRTVRVAPAHLVDVIGEERLRHVEVVIEERRRHEREPHALQRVHRGVDAERRESGEHAQPHARDPAELVGRAPDQRGANQAERRTERRLATLAHGVATEVVAASLLEGKRERRRRERQERKPHADSQAAVYRRRALPCILFDCRHLAIRTHVEERRQHPAKKD